MATLSPARMRVVRLLAFVLVPAAFIGFVAYSFLTTAPPKSLVGTNGPEFRLPLLGGDQTLSSEDLKGHPVVLNFWASWCVPCREEAPTLEAAWKKYESQGVKIVGVNVQDSKEDAAAFVKEFGLTYPSVRDTDLQLYTKLGVAGMPETFFLSRDYVFVGVGSGRQVGQSGTTKILGAISPAVLDAQIRSMLQGNG
ncbi:MAG: TlpA family protein disulfide reductase [Actinomycetota bacterium]|nr:TlpA family protein disulfide reductase [Actinomycetota bacterium]